MPLVKRLLEVPNLSSDEITKITQLVFYAPAAQSSDVLLIFGAPEGDWEVAAEAYHAGLAKVIVASGGVHERTNGVPESELIKDELLAHGVPAEAILTVPTPTNTLDNVLHFKRLLEANRLKPKSILYLTIYHHSGRCFLTLKKYFPDAMITAIHHGILYSGLDIRRDTWTRVEGAEKRVYGEYERIMTYSAKGDIADPSVIPKS